MSTREKPRFCRIFSGPKQREAEQRERRKRSSAYRAGHAGRPVLQEAGFATAFTENGRAEEAGLAREIECVYYGTLIEKGKEFLSEADRKELRGDERGVGLRA